MGTSKTISTPLTVGSISSLKELQNLDSDDTPGFDVLEVRLDGLGFEELEDALWLCLRVKSWGVPILITARDKAEGGIQDLTTEERAARLTQFSEVTTYVDVEIANYELFEETLATLRNQGIKIVLSYHNFATTPDNLMEQYQLAMSYKADIPKFAVMHHSIEDLAKCCHFIQSVNSPVSLMGMGALAPVSRLLYAQFGSLLNYGYLGDTPTAPGQWSAKMLKQGIANLEPL